MRLARYTSATIFSLILCLQSLPGFAQLGITFDIKKPKEYEERILRSEKSDQKKFTLPTRLIQNTVTHYNYFFNANNKLNEVLERAKTSHSDDYSKLLPFYNYSLDVTAGDSIQLDSISYKSQSGIALHDLRNDWIDNLYLLWGASYYLKKQFDSASLMFQFINYAFAEKEKDGYYKNIGSSKDGNTAFSISTKEKNSLPRRVFSEPPSRNDAFIWQIRNFLARDQFAEAASMIVTLKSDPAFPKRLAQDLHEVQSLWFYKQNIWDSAAAHLVLALDNATNKQERARWEFLAAQLFEMAGNNKEAEKYYSKVIGHTTDLIMEIYARLYTIRVNKDGKNDIERNIAELVKMARRDKYLDYQDIIYYMAAQMELERNNIEGAMSMLEKSIKIQGNSITHRNKAFLQLAELAFSRKEYRKAYNYYDSLRLDDPALTDLEAIMERKSILGSIASNMEIIERQDSLQRIARLGEEERKEFVRKLVRQLRQQQGLKDEPGMTTGSTNIPLPPSLFGNNEAKGEWYFYNTQARTRGQNDFKSRWGSRPNVDNWRRSAVIGPGQGVTLQNPFNPNKTTATNTTSPGGNEISFEALYDRLPLTPEAIKISGDSLTAALFALGKLYIQDLEDCSAGTITYENLRSRYPEFDKMDEVLFNLYYCYHKNGEKDKAAAIQKLLNDKFPNSNFTTIVTTGKNPRSVKNPDATHAYERIYDLFIEGNFEEAIAEKHIADSMYGRNYWTPQLLYIEAVYYTRQREDSTAISILNNITTQFSQSPLSARATALVNVLSRRNEIEEELRNLVINRPPEDSVAKKTEVVIQQPARPKTDSVVVNRPQQPPVVRNTPDTLSNKPAPKFVNSPFTHAPETDHYVVLILNKVDPVFINEARNAFNRYNRETFYNKPMDAQLTELDADNKLLLIRPFKNAQEAIDYVDRTRPRTASEIIPWLRGGKYSFSIITEKNLNLLLANKDLAGYKSFLNQQFAGKFLD